DVAGVLGKHAIDLAVILQRAEANARLRGRALGVGDAHVVLSPCATGDGGSKHKFMSANFVGFNDWHIIPYVIGLRKHFRYVDLLLSAVNTGRKICQGSPSACRHLISP